MTTTYHAQVQRSAAMWAVYVPEVDSWTQACHLHEVDTMARDLIAIMEDVDPDSIEIDTEI